MLGETELFRVEGRLGSFSEDERAKAIAGRLRAVAEELTIPESDIRVVDSEVGSDIVIGDRILFTVTGRDAAAAETTAAALARSYASAMRSAVANYRREYSRERLLRGSLVTAAITLVLFFSCWVSARLLRWLGTRLLLQLRGTRAAQLSVTVLGPDRALRVQRGVYRTFLLLAVAGLLHLYLILVAVQFPGTRTLGSALVEYLTRPLYSLLSQFVAQLPNLIFVAVTFLVAIVVNKLLRLFFESVENESLHLPGFYPDWAEPTYKLSALVIIVAAAVISFPYVPGSSSPAFQAVSLLAGVLVSIGSTSLVGNAFAGVVLIYMRAFRVGDRVKIADTMGDVEEKTLLVTRIKTVKNEHITIANSMILSNHVINFSKAADLDGLILYTNVTIGYDAPWRAVHDLLLRAAARTPFVAETPEPFVLQTSLDDSYVSYQINVFTKYPRKMTTIYSELRQNIQDLFNEGGVEIMSPAYHAVRDGNHVTIPKNHLPEDYEAPAFRLAKGGSPAPVSKCVGAE
jgi:small-conductance mechanosensitive channel